MMIFDEKFHFHYIGMRDRKGKIEKKAKINHSILVLFSVIHLVVLIVHTNFIRITCPCDLYPLTPNFYIVKMGFTGVHFFLIFALKHRGGSNVYPRSMFGAKIRKISQFFI